MWGALNARLLENSALQPFCLVRVHKPCSSGFIDKALSQLDCLFSFLGRFS